MFGGAICLAIFKIRLSLVESEFALRKRIDLKRRYVIYDVGGYGTVEILDCMRRDQQFGGDIAACVTDVLFCSTDT